MNRTNRDLFKDSYIFAQNEEFWLTRPREEELDKYLQVFEENSDSKAAFRDPAYRGQVWEELNREDSLYVSVVRKKDGFFCGYLGMVDLNEEIWELAIEFLKECQGKGIGSQSLQLFLRTLKEKTGMSEYISRVEGHNFASQKFMEKLGGVMSGVNVEYDRQKGRMIKIMEYQFVV